MRTRPEQYWSSIKVRSFEDVFKASDSHGLTLSKIESDIGEPFLRATMTLWITSFISFYSIGDNGGMNAYQIADLIELIRELYPHYTQEDFKLFFNQAKKGFFEEKVYGRIDGEVILRWLSIYDRRRDEKAQELSIKEADRYKPLYATDLIGGVSFLEYQELKKRAENGDKEAIKALSKPT